VTVFLKEPLQERGGSVAYFLRAAFGEFLCRADERSERFVPH
jgi:hypothetical protein